MDCGCLRMVVLEMALAHIKNGVGIGWISCFRCAGSRGGRKALKGARRSGWGRGDAPTCKVNCIELLTKENCCTQYIVKRNCCHCSLLFIGLCSLQFSIMFFMKLQLHCLFVCCFFVSLSLSVEKVGGARATERMLRILLTQSSSELHLKGWWRDMGQR